MKNLKLRSFFLSLLVIAMVTVFLSSCEKDQISKSSTQNQAQKELEQLKAKVSTEATFRKKIIIKDDKAGFSGTFAFYTNVPELLNSVTEKNITLKLGGATVEPTSEKYGVEAQEDANQKFVPIDLDRNIVKIELLNISFSNQKDVPVFSFKFEDELRLAINHHNVITIMDLDNIGMNRGCSNGISSVKMTSDGRWDFKKAEARVYYRWNNCNFFECRSGLFYNCLTSKVTNTGAACNDAYISSVIRVGSEPVWTTFFKNCNASC